MPICQCKLNLVYNIHDDEIMSFKCVMICMTCTSIGESYLLCLSSPSNYMGEADHHLHKEKEITIQYVTLLMLG